MQGMAMQQMVMIPIMVTPAMVMIPMTTPIIMGTPMVMAPATPTPTDDKAVAAAPARGARAQRPATSATYDSTFTIPSGSTSTSISTPSAPKDGEAAWAPSPEMVKAAEAKREEAAAALNKVLASSKAWRVKDIESALASVVSRVSSPERVASALATLQDTSSAPESCPPDPELIADLRVAENALRDHLVWKVQLLCPLDDSKMFKATLLAAVGDMNLDTFSQLMNSRNKVVGNLPKAFPSNAAARKRRRRASRGRAARPRETPADDREDKSSTQLVQGGGRWADMFDEFNDDGADL
mmetsp:Transcript_39389/g.116804  ORF Transcript_39389/g.116804 Transcript_39389/m.116804 type:complete len:297 (-) Transcript_39389:165-1055(-)